jgi:bacterioferritin-associated ferredoxin
MTTVHLQTLAGHTTLNLQFDDHRRVLSAQGLSDGDQSAEEVLNWLCQWLPGRELTVAQESAAEELLTSHPEWGLLEAKLVDTLLRDAVYQTHRQVKLTGMILCFCHKVDRQVVQDFIRDNPNCTRADVVANTKASSGCGKCAHDVEALIEAAAPLEKRWNGDTNSNWILKLQESLNLWLIRKIQYPKMDITSFRVGVVKIKVNGALTADQEWDLVNELSDYWSDGFAASFSVFLDFSLAQASK